MFVVDDFTNIEECLPLHRGRGLKSSLAGIGHIKSSVSLCIEGED